MIREIDGITVDVQKKNIKNMHLRIRKDATVLLTAPMRVSEASMERFVRDNREWIVSNIIRIEGINEEKSRSLDDGSVISVLGIPHTLHLMTGDRTCLRCDDGRIDIFSDRTLSFEEKESLLNELYRMKLEERLSFLVPKWEAITGLKCSSWHTKIMRTRWGTCNTVTHRVWFSVRLGSKSDDLIEYVVVHELLHILIGNHGPDFKRLMSEYIPDWKDRKKRLNS